MSEAPLDLTSQPLTLKDLVAFQPQSIVSRTLFNHPNGTMTVFACAAGEGLREHTAPYDALVLVLEGNATITVGTQAHEVSTGQFLRLPAHTPHTLKAQTPFIFLLTMFRA